MSAKSPRVVFSNQTCARAPSDKVLRQTNSLHLAWSVTVLPLFFNTRHNGNTSLTRR